MLARQSYEPKSATIQGATGEFSVSNAGATREAFSYLYKDERHKFIFYADVVSKPIWAATVQSTSGLLVGSGEEAVIKENITRFFRTRNFIQPDKEVLPGAENIVVTFNWKVVR